MRIKNLEIYLSKESRTGISLLAGSRDLTVTSLPEFSLEIHRFRDAYGAESFIEGLSLLGPINSFAYQRETGSLDANRCVIIARFDHLKRTGSTLEEVLSIVDHHGSRIDSETISRQSNDSIAQRRQDYERVRSIGQQVLGLISTSNEAPPNCVDSRFFDNTLRTKINDVSGFELTWTDPQGPFRVSLLCDQNDQNSEVAHLLAETCKEFGFTYDRQENEIVGEGVVAENLHSQVRSMIEVLQAFEDKKRSFWQQRFCESFKLTPNRRKFLKGAATSGISAWIVRRNQNASAGGVHIKRSEIEGMVRRGWITRKGPGLEISDDGRKAIAHLS